MYTILGEWFSQRLLCGFASFASLIDFHNIANNLFLDCQGQEG